MFRIVWHAAGCRSGSAFWIARWSFFPRRYPDVGDNVTIYPNATILGGKTLIGANSTIGANVFLMHSVPANSLVVYEEKQLSIRDKPARRPVEDSDYAI